MRTRYKLKSLLLVCLCLLLFLPGCAKKTPSPQASFPGQASIADLSEFPQDLEVYARETGASKRLLTEAEQAAMDQTFNEIYFGPWSMHKTSISRREVAGVFGRARGYKANGVPWEASEWEAIKANAALGSFPGRAVQAITLRQTDLREVPTHQPRYSKPSVNQNEDPFDYIQYSILPPGMPLLIAHASADRNWYYIECPIAGGWVDAKDIAPVDENFKAVWRADKFAALIKDNVVLPGIGPNGKDGKAGIGAILPIAKQGIGGKTSILAPVAGRQGFASVMELPLSGQEIAVKPMPLTPGNVAKVGNVMMGQLYGWGGTFGNRDCSAMMRDLFAPFGVWLPRNSGAQARRGAVVRLEGLDSAQKAAVILAEGKPFLSLVGLPGHITLYVGRWKNKPALFHNVWGLRIIKDGNDDERLLIGRAVVTSITPGMELENLYRPKTFVDRVRTITTLRPR